MLEYLPDPYPDELLYSVWARYSAHVRYPNKMDVFQELFGTTGIQATVDLPSHLGYFVGNLPLGQAYTVDYFIDRHTLLPFYAAFHAPEQVGQLREQMISDNGQALHRKAGVSQTTIPSPHWLRYCPRCVQADRENFGECYWHRLHQVPGVEICPSHRTWLEDSAVRARNNFTTREFISAECASVATAARNAETSPFIQTFMDVAIDVFYLLEHPCACDPHSLQKRYRSLLAQHGFLPTGSKIRMTGCLKAFLDHYPPALLTALHCGITPPRFVHNTWLFRIMHPSEKSQHPLRHILAIRFLGSSLEAFFHLDIEPAQPFGEGPWPCLNPVCEYYQQEHIAVCQVHRHQKNGRPKGRFACTCGFSYSRTGPDRSPDDTFRRDQILVYGAVWETSFRNLWSDVAESLSSMSRRLGIVISAVKRQAVKLGLPFPRVSTWSTVTGKKQNPQEEETLRRRTQWLALLENAPEGEGRSSLSRKLPSVYAWLYKHDKAWLLAHRPPKRQRSVRQQTPLFSPPIDEVSLHEGVVSQDARMSEAVRARAALIIAQDPPKRVTMNRIRMDIPQVLQLKNMPEKAPLTVHVLQEVIETWEAFAVRRIWRIVQKYQEMQVCPSRNRLIWSTRTQTHLHVPIVKQALDDAMCVLSRFV